MPIDVVTDNSVIVAENGDCVHGFTVKSAGVAVNITGATFEGAFRWDYDDANAAIELAAGDFDIITAADGTVEFTILAADTTGLTLPTTGLEVISGGGYPIYFDINMTLGGVTSRVLRGVAMFYRSALQA